MRPKTYALVAAAMAIGLVALACSSSPTSGTKTTGAMTSTTANPTAATTTASQASGSTQLQSLIPTPANTQRTDGPESIPGNGIHMHFFVNGAPTDVLAAYKTALEGKGWSVTVVSSGGGGGGGGATYTATQGGTYGVFGGGGAGSTTDVNACAWPSQPSNPNCGSVWAGPTSTSR